MTKDIEITLKDIKDVAKVTNLLNEGIQLSKFHIPSKTDIMLEAIVNKQQIMIHNFIERGFDLKNGEFLYLHHAVRTEEFKIVKLIIEKMKDNLEFLNKTDNLTGNNALHVAIETNKTIEIPLLLSNSNIDWNQKNKQGQTPIHFLLRNKILLKDKNIIELLKSATEKKADFTIKDVMDISPTDIINSYSLSDEWHHTKAAKFLCK